MTAKESHSYSIKHSLLTSSTCHPMQTSEALLVLGVQPLPIGDMRSQTRQSAQPLAGHPDGLSKLFMPLYGLQVRNIL